MRFLICAAATVCLGVLTVACSGTQSAGTSAAPTPVVAVTKSGFGDNGKDLFSDDELNLLERFHSTPGVDVHLVVGVHVQVLGTSSTRRIIQIDYGAGVRMPTVFEHVRVLDGPARGQEGWMAVSDLEYPSPDPQSAPTETTRDSAHGELARTYFNGSGQGELWHDHLTKVSAFGSAVDIYLDESWVSNPMLLRSACLAVTKYLRTEGTQDGFKYAHVYAHDSPQRAYFPEGDCANANS